MEDDQWRPILEGAQASAALEVAKKLGHAIAEVTGNEPTSDQATLGRGWAGQALALSYLDHHFPDEGFEVAGKKLLGSAADAVTAQPMSVGLMQGFTGVAWAISHLSPDPDLSDIDKALEGLLSRPVWPGDYDLVSGLVGVGVYAIARHGQGNDKLLELVVRKLIGLAEQHPEGLAWFTPPELILASKLGRAPKGFYNLGMAHGMPGVVALLSDAMKLGMDDDDVRQAANGATSYLLTQRLEGSFANWPFFVGDEIDVMPSRLAWCYGDPGVISALLRYVDTNPDGPATEALDKAIAKMLGRPSSTTGTTGASLCHGSAGLALMFARMSFHLDRDDLAQEAARWVTSTLESYDDKLPLGYSVWEPSSGREDGDVQGPGLLAGVAGVALALVACATDQAPNWDRVLLLSGPPR